MFGAEAVNTRRQDALDGDGDVDPAGNAEQATGPRSATKNARLDEMLDALFKEEGIPLGPVDQFLPQIDESHGGA